VARLDRILEVVAARGARVGVPILMNRVFSDPVRKINREYLEKLDEISRRMREERGAGTGAAEKFRAVLVHLERFEETEDAAHLERAMEESERTGCEVCQRFIGAALRAAREGKMGEARARIRGFRRGVEAVLP